MSTDRLDEIQRGIARMRAEDADPMSYLDGGDALEVLDWAEWLIARVRELEDEQADGAGLL